MSARPEVIVAGHICLDLIPSFTERTSQVGDLLTPGKLLEVGAAVISTGGAVSNTGLALHRLGVPVRLMGKIGDDLLGRAIVDVLRSYGPGLADGMIVTPGESSSYSIVISPPGVDRLFLHCPGANDTFSAADVDLSQLAGARLLHFGYPPLMRRMYIDGGRELGLLLRQVKRAGLTTSLDMAKPDPESEAGRASWPELLARVLPHVDIFLPSLDEILFMVDRSRFEKVQKRAGAMDSLSPVDGALLGEMSESLLRLGVALVVLKLGDHGLYLRTTGDASRLQGVGDLALGVVGQWAGRELLAPCFHVNVVGTTGSGDCTIAGFLAGFLRGLPPEEVMACAVAVGACNVEAADATSGVPSWDQVQQRISSGWMRRDVSMRLPNWRWDPEKTIWMGPGDARF